MTALYQPASARWKALEALGNNYAWWLGKRSAPLRKLIDCTGWRLSHIAYRLSGRPAATLSWPLGLSYLLLNGDPAKLAPQARWADKGLSCILVAGQTLPQLHVDMAGLGYAALMLESCFNVEHDYLSHARVMGERYLARAGARDGLITYAEHRTEVLVDTLGMLSPFLARLSRITGDTRYLDTALAQLNSFTQYAVDADSGWVVHGFDAITRRPIGPPGWGRGIGWQLLGLTDTLLELSAPELRYPLERLCHALLSKLATVQLANGHWPWLLTDTTAQRSDSSVTAMVCYCLGRLLGQSAGAASPFFEFHPQLMRGRAALDHSTTEAGLVDDCSGEATGAGAYSNQFGCHLWALAPAVAADAIALPISIPGTV